MWCLLDLLSWQLRFGSVNISSMEQSVLHVLIIHKPRKWLGVPAPCDAAGSSSKVPESPRHHKPYPWALSIPWMLRGVSCSFERYSLDWESPPNTMQTAASHTTTCFTGCYRIAESIWKQQLSISEVWQCDLCQPGTENWSQEVITWFLSRRTKEIMEDIWLWRAGHYGQSWTTIPILPWHWYSSIDDICPALEASIVNFMQNGKMEQLEDWLSHFQLRSKITLA